jgi:capsular exopolysaccharide synthesis family protein
MAELGHPQLPSTDSPLAGLVVFLKTLRKHWTIVLACIAVACAGTLIYSKSIRRVYQASSLLEINPRSAPLLGDSTNQSSFDVTSLFVDPTEYYQTQYKIMTSVPVLKAAAEALSLQNDSDFLELKAPPAHPIPVDVAAAALAGHVTVDPIKGSRLAYIRVTDFDPKRAKRICDAVANAYIEQNLESAINSSSDAVVWLDNQVANVKGDLEQDENALYDFKQKNNLPSISINDSSNMLRLELQEYDTALTHTRTKKAELMARVAELEKVTPESPDSVASSEFLSNEYLQSLRGQYRHASDEVQSLLADGKGENHPTVKEAAQRLSDARQALVTEVANLKASVKQDLVEIEQEETGENSLFEEARRKAVDLNMKEIEYHRLDRTREQNEKLYGLLLSRMKEADLGRMMRANNLRVVEAAAVPGAPIYPRVGVNIALGLLVGFLFGLGLPLLREQLDSSVKTPGDVEEKLGVTFLGLLPELAASERKGERKGSGRRRRVIDNMVGEGASELIVHNRPASGVSEAIRSIRTNLMFMNPDKPYRMILVSSAAPAEGKTTVACSIAIALAQGGQRVCIVDADLRRPRLHRIFDRRGDAGLTSTLVDDATLDQVAKPTMVENLWSIPSGPLPPNPADLLQSEKFKGFIRQLSERFDRVVIDSPPLAAVTDAAIISTLVDGTVFVVRAFKTGKHVSAQGLRALYDVESPVIGAVLNAVNLNHNDYTYYQYYYYKREGYAPLESKPGGDASSAAAPPN